MFSADFNLLNRPSLEDDPTLEKIPGRDRFLDELSFRVSVKLGTSEFHRKGGNSQCPGPAPSEIFQRLLELKSLKSWVNLVACKSAKKTQQHEILRSPKKSSHLIDHSLSHFSPVLVREDQEHFNRSILPGFFF